MKAYTDIEQSRKLAKILPLESADCFWDYDDLQKYHRIDWFEDGYDKDSQLRLNKNNVCAWSLAALLDVLPFHLIVNNQRYAFSMVKGLDKNGETYAIKYTIFNTTIYFHLTDFYNNPVDTCVEMIFKLNELKML